MALVHTRILLNHCKGKSGREPKRMHRDYFIYRVPYGGGWWVEHYIYGLETTDVGGGEELVVVYDSIIDAIYAIDAAYRLPKIA